MIVQNLVSFIRCIMCSDQSMVGMLEPIQKIPTNVDRSRREKYIDIKANGQVACLICYCSVESPHLSMIDASLKEENKRMEGARWPSWRNTTGN